MFWDKEKNIMIRHFYAKIKKSKKSKAMYNKLTMLDSYTKEHMLRTYYEKCKLEYTVRFFDRKL